MAKKPVARRVDLRTDGHSDAAFTARAYLHDVSGETASISVGPRDGVGTSRRRTIASVHGSAARSGT